MTSTTKGRQSFAIKSASANKRYDWFRKWKNWQQIIFASIYIDIESIALIDIIINIASILAMVYAAVAVFGEYFLNAYDENSSDQPSFWWCDEYDPNYEEKFEGVYSNPSYDPNPCLYIRTHYLLYLTIYDCEMIRRMLSAVVFGAFIGLERNHSRDTSNERGVASKPRTLAVISLGSAFFTLVSIYAFRTSSMGWDSSRVSAAIPSGVGFLGTALIWKQQLGETGHEVKGLTSASSVWISAAAGVGAGGGLYFVAGYSVVMCLIVQRFGPQLYLEDDMSFSDDESSSGIDDQSKYDSSLSLHDNKSLLDEEEATPLIATNERRTAEKLRTFNS